MTTPPSDTREAAYHGESMKGKDLHRIGVTLGLIEDSPYA
jgi:hypothetical protein